METAHKTRRTRKSRKTVDIDEHHHIILRQWATDLKISQKEVFLKALRFFDRMMRHEVLTRWAAELGITPKEACQKAIAVWDYAMQHSNPKEGVRLCVIDADGVSHEIVLL